MYEKSLAQCSNKEKKEKKLVMLIFPMGTSWSLHGVPRLGCKRKIWAANEIKEQKVNDTLSNSLNLEINF